MEYESLWYDYSTTVGYDEMVDPTAGFRPHAERILGRLSSWSPQRWETAVATLRSEIIATGVTFTVYGEGESLDRAWPLDLTPRTMALSEWERIERGLKQRLMALNLLLNDLYHEQRIVRAGAIPGELIATSRHFLKACVGAKPPRGVWAHVLGADLVRDRDGTIYVLEDNLRVPSGVSYMLENRQLMKRLFPDLFAAGEILPNDDYPQRLFATLAALAPHTAGERPVVAVLTPGVYNSAYFEHAYLAQQMGAFLVEGRDCFVGEDDGVYMKTVAGPRRIDVLYRRVDDVFLDPEVFRADSLLGIRGLIRAWRRGKVAIANAPGTGVVDDKVVYAFVPQAIRYYLGEEPILPNVPSWLCFYPDQRNYVLAHLPELVVKPANESGGKGMVIGPRASRAELAEVAARIEADPRSYMAQPTLALSTAPVYEEGRFVPRHVDLRPFVLQGEDLYVTPGGLTRVALAAGSLVVNSSQGGGSKDTWVVVDR
ncbi:MAG: circularly permuted type 2 ATP-grasp protein [Hydrogenophilus sp.]|nr:circularly permuted type 2 ATP-grasp protein [Hydrogenophilus sp.]